MFQAKKKAKINSARKNISAHFWNFPGIWGSFTGCRSFLPEFQVEIKNAGPVIILAGMVLAEIFKQARQKVAALLGQICGGIWRQRVVPHVWKGGLP